MAALDLTGYKLAFDDEFNTLSVSQTGANAGNGTIRVAPAWHGGMSNEIAAQQGNAVNDALGAWGSDVHAASAGEIANLPHNLRFDHIWHSA
jgi:hypothetical protein